MVLRFIRGHQVVSYFAGAYALSAVALLVIGFPDLSGRTPVPSSSFVMFPVLVVGVALSGITLTALTSGVAGLRQLWARSRRWRLGRWLLALLIPPVGISVVLLAFRIAVSPSFAAAPTVGFTAFGLGIGLVAGFFEEIGWTGFAYPRLSTQLGPLGGALLLGLLWGLWHFPVVDSLGAASPHGPYLPAYFASFVVAMIATRVLIAWLYTNTGSLLIAQLLHASSTASLVALSAPHVSPAQESLWYLGYAGLLWLIVGVVVLRYGTSLQRKQPSLEAAPALAGGGS